MQLIRKIWNRRSYLHSILSTIYFNFRYLPISQALKLPIIFYKPKFCTLKGCVKIYGDVHFGMIRLGFSTSLLYPNSGITIELLGGVLSFRGKCTIGNASAISVGPEGVLSISGGLVANSALKLIAYHNVTLDSDARIGWNVSILDTNFHPLVCRETGLIMKPYGSIVIGSSSWIASNCVILHDVILPNHVVVASNSLVSKSIDFEPYTMVAGSPAKVVRKGIYRNIGGMYDYVEHLQKEERFALFGK